MFHAKLLADIYHRRYSNVIKISNFTTTTSCSVNPCRGTLNLAEIIILMSSSNYYFGVMKGTHNRDLIEFIYTQKLFLISVNFLLKVFIGLMYHVETRDQLKI